MLSDTLVQVESKMSANLAGFKATGIYPMSREQVISKLPYYTKSVGLNSVKSSFGAEFNQYLENIRISDISAPQRNRKYQLPVLSSKSVSAKKVEAFYKNKVAAKQIGKGKRKKEALLDMKKRTPKKKKVTKKCKSDLSSESESDIDIALNKNDKEPKLEERIQNNEKNVFRRSE